MLMLPITLFRVDVDIDDASLPLCLPDRQRHAEYREYTAEGD